MTLEPDVCYRALRARDPRFDGVFFVGVTTTGIYCRPVCPARLPAFERCRFFREAGAAEAEGFRPCLRCRPERAPGRAIVDATRNLASRAAARIGAGALNGSSVDRLASELHVGARQLRRALRQEYGTTPVQLAQTHRLLLAKRLLTETALPVTEVAFASGFSSVRRFNALFRERYRMQPSAVRRNGGTDGGLSSGPLTLRLDYRPPLDWAALLAFLGARAIPGVEQVEGEAYRRTIAVEGREGWIAARPARGSAPALELDVSLSLLPVLMTVLARVRSLFDLDAEPGCIHEHLSADSTLGSAVRRRPGLRVPGAVHGFEVAWRAVVGQQVSVEGAQTLAGRLAAALGDEVTAAPSGLMRLSPAPERVAEAASAELRRIGLTRARAECLVALARVMAEGGLRLEPGADPAPTLGALRAIPGIGPWTAQYVAMRALQWPDAFPHGDLGLRRAMGGVSTPALERAAERWRPWRAYAAMHLWQTLPQSEETEDARPSVPPRAP